MFKRNIAHLTSVHPAFDNRVFFKECRSLVQAGYNLALVAPHKHDEIVEGIRIHAIPKIASITLGVRGGAVLRRPLYADVM